MTFISWHRERASASPQSFARGFKSVDLEGRRFADVVRYKVWSPIIWTDGTRRQDHFESSEILALDFDDGRLSLDGAVDWVTSNRLAHLIGTTKNHGRVKGNQSACDRYRILLFFSSPIPHLADYIWNVKLAVRKLPADIACVDGARFFYPCAKIISQAQGKLLRPVKAPASLPSVQEIIDRQVERAQAYERAHAAPSWVLGALEHGVPEGGGAGRGRHSMIYRIGAELARQGYSDEHLVGLILNSPLSAVGEDDVRRTARDGARRGREDLESHRRREAGKPPKNEAKDGEGAE